VILVKVKGERGEKLMKKYEKRKIDTSVLIIFSNFLFVTIKA